ncbi:MAG TPA: hypothetical protein DCQ30_01685 [Acidimicrobiaceae bacterium]|nr:hypothetical protein [Acidimicrobiaceae bacterium]
MTTAPSAQARAAALPLHLDAGAALELVHVVDLFEQGRVVDALCPGFDELVLELHLRLGGGGFRGVVVLDIGDDRCQGDVDLVRFEVQATLPPAQPTLLRVLHLRLAGRDVSLVLGLELVVLGRDVLRGRCQGEALTGCRVHAGKRRHLLPGTE